MLSLPVWLKSPWRGSDPLFQFAVIRVHRRSSAVTKAVRSWRFLAASAPLRETFPLSIEPVLSLPKGWIGEEAAGRRGEASPCFPWRPGDWPEGFIPCPAYGLPVQTF